MRCLRITVTGLCLWIFMVSVYRPAAAEEPSSNASPDKIRVLLVTGNDYPGHEWKLTTPAVRQILEQDPRMIVRIVEDPEFLASPGAGSVRRRGPELHELGKPRSERSGRQEPAAVRPDRAKDSSCCISRAVPGAAGRSSPTWPAGSGTRSTRTIRAGRSKSISPPKITR